MLILNYNKMNYTLKFVTKSEDGDTFLQKPLYAAFFAT